MALDLICSLRFFDLRLFGGGREALAIAERLGDLRLRIHAQSLAGGLSALAASRGWAIESMPPSPARGQCWLVATGDPLKDDELVALAERAGVAVFVPRWPERSSVRLPLEVGRAPDSSAASSRNRFQLGRVSLVGAGPGDPELLTLKALARLREAEVLIHDRLVSDEVLALAAPGARRLYVGKARSRHSVPQEGINQALVDWARAGYRVVRLKGGDPFVFGRGGEELERLAEAEIDFEVIPGITAAIGVSAYTGIPLTHRDHAQSVRFITGHLSNGSIDLDWPTLAAPGQTLVFYMGLGSLEVIARQLIEHGMGPDTPIALVEQGTTARQRVHVDTLAGIAASIAGLDIAPPTLIVVGGVVSLYRSLSWFERASAASLGWCNGKHPSPLDRAGEA